MDRRRQDIGTGQRSEPGRGSVLDPEDRAADVLDSMRAGRATAFDLGRGASIGEMRERVAAFVRRIDGRVAVGLAASAVVVAVVIAAVIVRSGTTAASEPPPVSVPAAVAVPTTTTSGPGVVVQASGAIRSPGVYRLPIGARVVDLLERAGGPTPELDLDRVNLAALLVDGQRVWLPRVGESPPAAVGPSSGSGSSSSSPALVDVNHAGIEQLDTLPGIGRTIASAIVADREKRGVFRSVDDLLRVKGLTRSKVDAIRDLVLIG